MPSCSQNATSSQSGTTQMLGALFQWLKASMRSPGYFLTLAMSLQVNLVEAANDAGNQQHELITDETPHNLSMFHKEIKACLAEESSTSTIAQQSQFNRLDSTPYYTGPTTIDFPIGRLGVSNVLSNYFVDPKNESIVHYGKVRELSSPWFNVNANNGIVTATLLSGYQGKNYTIIATATNKQGMTGEQMLKITAPGTRLHIPPKHQQMSANQVSMLALPVYDYDGDYIIVESAPLPPQQGFPSWVTFEPKSNTFVFHPKSDDQRVYNFTMQLRECFQYPQFQDQACSPEPITTFIHTIIHNNSPYQKASFKDQTINAYEPWRYSIAQHFKDPDSDQLYFKVDNKPDWLEHNTQSDELEAYPTSLFKPEVHNLLIHAFDRHGGHAQANLRLRTQPLLPIVKWLTKASEQLQYCLFQRPTMDMNDYEINSSYHKTKETTSMMVTDGLFANPDQFDPDRLSNQSQTTQKAQP